jgi:hypothetical protein
VFVGFMTGVVVGTIGFGAFVLFRRGLPHVSPPTSDAPPSAPDPQHLSLKILPNGLEAFTPLPLQAGRVYRVTAEGTYPYKWRAAHEFVSHTNHADAAYFQDESGSYTRPYAGLWVDGVKGRDLHSWRENRAVHQYSALIEGIGRQACIRLYAPEKENCKVDGLVSLRFDLLPENTPGLPAKKTAAEIAAEIAAQEAERKQEKETAKHDAELRKRISYLALKVHHQRNWLDPAFCRQYAKENTKSISEGKSFWIREYKELMADTELVTALRQQAPDVLEWYERRVDVVNLAERFSVMPNEDDEVKLETPTPAIREQRRITARTIGQVERAIAELFQQRDIADDLREQQAKHGFDKGRQEQLDAALRAMEFRFELLRAYGVSGKSPEAVEEKFFQLCPSKPVLTLYEELAEKIKAKEEVSPDAVTGRLEDLHREEIILQARRRRSVRTGKDGLRENLDQRLSAVRREATVLRDFLTSLGCKIEFPDFREKEETREEQFFKLMREEDAIMAALKQKGDEQGVEHVEALYAQERAKLFAATTDDYA